MDNNLTAAFLSGYLGGVVFGTMVAISLYRKFEEWERSGTTIDVAPAESEDSGRAPVALINAAQQG
jgi:hypothetical protein